MKEEMEVLEQTIGSEYKYGFVTDIETETVPKGINESIVRLISKKKNENQEEKKYQNL